MKKRKQYIEGRHQNIRKQNEKHVPTVNYKSNDNVTIRLWVTHMKMDECNLSDFMECNKETEKKDALD